VSIEGQGGAGLQQQGIPFSLAHTVGLKRFCRGDPVRKEYSAAEASLGIWHSAPHKIAPHNRTPQCQTGQLGYLAEGGHGTTGHHIFTQSPAGEGGPGTKPRMQSTRWTLTPGGDHGPHAVCDPCQLIGHQKGKGPRAPRGPAPEETGEGHGQWEQYCPTLTV